MCAKWPARTFLRWPHSGALYGAGRGDRDLPDIRPKRNAGVYEWAGFNCGLNERAFQNFSEAWPQFADATEERQKPTLQPAPPPLPPGLSTLSAKKDADCQCNRVDLGPVLEDHAYAKKTTWVPHYLAALSMVKSNFTDLLCTGDR